MQHLDEKYLADLETDDPIRRSRAATALQELGHAEALRACIQTLDDAPDPGHSDRTPAVKCLIAIGKPAIDPLLAELDSNSSSRRIRAQRAIQGISRRLFGFDGKSWSEEQRDRWLEWWDQVGYRHDASRDERLRAAARLRLWRETLR